MSDISPQPTPAASDHVGVLPLAPPPVAVSPPTAAQSRWTIRLWCTFIFIGCGIMMGIAFKLDPHHHGNYPGTGTHEQLGLPACGLLRMSGWPCPTCGCTTAVSYFAHGHLISSLLTQPFGFAVAVIATLLIPLTLIGIVAGKWVGPSMFSLAWNWQYWVYGSIGIFLLGWAYKCIIMRAHITF